VILQIRVWCELGQGSNQTTDPTTEATPNTTAMRWPSSRGRLPDGARTFSVPSTTTAAPANVSTANLTLEGVDSPMEPAEGLAAHGGFPTPMLWVLVGALVVSLGLSMRILQRRRQLRTTLRRRDRQTQQRWSLFRRSVRPRRSVLCTGRPDRSQDYATPIQDVSGDPDGSSFHSAREEMDMEALGAAGKSLERGLTDPETL
jgi:hypothetical protein